MLMEPGLVIFAAFVALVVGFLVGRRSGNPREQIRELESRLEVAEKERELARASVKAAKEEITRVETELREYRAEVVEHFTGTSGLLRDLTVQYRSVYDHLTKGATSLCPEGSVSLLEGLRSELLPEEAGPSGAEPGEEGPEDETERSRAEPGEEGPEDETERSQAAPSEA
jgi:uncharacterized membrane-anchored protein YhcB (DUF1043 family)